MSRGTELATNRGPTELKTFFEERIEEIAKALPRHLSKERQVALLVNLVYRNPELAKCDKGSILASAITAGSLGLDLTPSLGECYLVPRWNKKMNGGQGGTECSFLVGYQGLAKLVHQTGLVASLQSRIVYRKDEFVVEYDPDLRFTHRPSFEPHKPGKDDVKVVYCIAKMANGERLMEVMNVEEIEGIRARSQSPNYGPWQTDWGEMARKTVLRRLVKSLPKSPELAKALEANDAEFDFENGASKPKIDNGTGYGSNKYAPPEKVAAYLEAIEKYLEERNQAWLDRWDRNGELPDGIKDLATRTQVDQHLLRWAVDTGRLDPQIDASDLKFAQVGKYTAIPWHATRADQNAMKRQLRDFLNEQEARQTDVLRTKHPELFEPEDFGDDEPSEEVIDAEVVKPESLQPPQSASKDKKKDSGSRAAKPLFEPVPREPGCDDE